MPLCPLEPAENRRWDRRGGEKPTHTFPLHAADTSEKNYTGALDSSRVPYNEPSKKKRGKVQKGVLEFYGVRASEVWKLECRSHARRCRSSLRAPAHKYCTVPYVRACARGLLPAKFELRYKVFKAIIIKEDLCSISIAKSNSIENVLWKEITIKMRNILKGLSLKIIICYGLIKYVQKKHHAKIIEEMHDSAVGGNK